MKISRSFLAVLVAAFVIVLAGGTSAQAITNGQPDGNAHPYVGLMVAIDEDGVPQWRCSGSLLSPTAFLTAGHCVEPPAAHIEIWFDAGPIERDPDYLEAVADDPDGIVSCNESPAFDGYPCEGDVGGDPHLNPDYCASPCGQGLPGFAFRDVGVVTLEEPVPTSLVGDYAELPEPELVDTLANKTRADFVGYGVQFQEKIPGNQLPQPPPFFRWTGDLIRMFAPSELVSQNFTHSDEFIRFSLNASQGKGGTCFGDSGGPDLLGGTDTVLAVNSYVTNVNCSGVGYSSRVDIPDVLNWIMGFMNR
jgi:Trypsin